MAKRFGFTLAEVLITLGIIGVVAAMTIPTLMNQTGQAEFKTGFKKMISTLNQAITMNVALDNSDFSVLLGSNTAGSATIYNMFNERMNIIRTATDSADIGAATSGNFTLFFNDGMAISFPNDDASCTESAPCYALVDVNGTKNPNTMTTASDTTDPDTLVVGDQFGIVMYDQQVLPYGEAAKMVLFN